MSDEKMDTESKPFEETESADSWKEIGNNYYKAKNYKQAVESYAKAIELDPTNALLFTNRAAAALMLSQFKEAIHDCDQAITLDQSCSKAYFRKATALKGLGKVDLALECLTTGLNHDPTNAAAKKDKTQLQQIKNKLTEAERLLNNNQYTSALLNIDNCIRELNNTNVHEINILKLKILVALKRNEEALNFSNTMMKQSNHGDVELLKLRASCLFAMSELESAIKHLQQGMRCDPDNTALRTQYRLYRDIDEKKTQGDEAFKRAQLKQAIDAWSECIMLIKSDSPMLLAKLYFNRATALSKENKFEDSLKDCNKAIYYNSEYVKAYIRRSEVFTSLGGPQNIQKSIQDLEKAIEIEQDEETVKSYKLKLKKAKVALKRSKRKDLYAILGVRQTATEGEIKTAYRKAALKYHPDKHASKTEEEKAEAEKMFKSANEAYEVLSNPEKKSLYDSGVEVENLDNPHAGGYSGYGGGDCDDDDGHGHGHHGHGGHGGGAGGIDPNILFQMFMQQQGGGRGGGMHFG